jgi:pimeloyl-ACP methyl ester carboxylesterase
MPDQLQELTFQNGPIVIHAVAAGPSDGPPLILLHGFPEFWYGWRHQIEPLARAGFRVVVPDQRGYNTSSKPSDVKSYALSAVSLDILAIADQLNWPRFHVCGHDWGAAVGWYLALHYPGRLTRLAILNVPHPAVMMHAVMTNLRQMLRSWYMLFFQIPWLPEALFASRQMRGVKDSLLRSSRPGAFQEAELDRYQAAWGQTRSISGMLNWYRAVFRYRPAVPEGKVKVPTRILWGRKDKFVLPELAEESIRRCLNGELFMFDEATHWIQHEEPKRVNELLISFFLNGPGSS